MAEEQAKKLQTEAKLLCGVIKEEADKRLAHVWARKSSPDDSRSLRPVTET
jgi:hypothetical protein